MVIDRRKALWVAGASLMGLAAAACSPSKPPQPSPTPTSVPSSRPSGPPDWESLRRQLSGALLLPEESGFSQAKLGFNPLFDQQSPAAVAKCFTSDQVKACVVAAAARVPIAARSGGHSYAGYSVPSNGLVIDLAQLSQIDLKDNGTIVIGAGAKLK